MRAARFFVCPLKDIYCCDSCECRNHVEKAVMTFRHFGRNVGSGVYIKLNCMACE